MDPKPRPNHARYIESLAIRTLSPGFNVVGVS